MRKKILTIILFTLTLNACFREDEPIIPNPSEVVKIEESVYTHQTFFDLDTRRIISTIQMDAWDIGFESADTGWHIILNSGRFLGLYSAGTTDFESVNSVPAPALWKFDKPDGNPDSTAVGEWLAPPSGPSYNTVFVIGVYDGIRYSPMKKIVFSSLSDDVYSFHYSNMDGTDPVSVDITKDPLTNFAYFSFSDGGKQIIIEPEKTKWDIVFTQYSTTLYTDLGVPTPYFVRGVLSNRIGVEVALDTIIPYSEFKFDDINGKQFSRSMDAIGHDWKSVDIDGTNAEYAIRQNYTFIIKSKQGYFYKLRFTGYYNDLGSPGFPRFEMSALY